MELGCWLRKTQGMTSTGHPKTSRFASVSRFDRREDGFKTRDCAQCLWKGPADRLCWGHPCCPFPEAGDRAEGAASSREDLGSNLLKGKWTRPPGVPTRLPRVPLASGGSRWPLRARVRPLSMGPREAMPARASRRVAPTRGARARPYPRFSRCVRGKTTTGTPRQRSVPTRPQAPEAIGGARNDAARARPH